MWLWASMAWAAEIRVTERGTGRPIADATVTIGDASYPVDADGRATTPDWAEVATVTVDAPGWQSTTVAAAADRPVRVSLVASARALEVVVEGLRQSPDATRHVVDAEQAFETPGALDDAVRLVQSLPGVAVQRELGPSAGDLAIRGASGPDNRYYLDGIQIPYLYHYNQYASVFPASSLSTLALYPSTFGSEYGNATGGVVEARSLHTRPEDVEGSASVNFVMAGGDVRAPVGKDGWVAVQGRRSYFDIAGEASAQYPVWPRFFDASVRGGVGDEAEGASFFALAAGDAYTRAAGELDALDPVEALQTPLFSFSHRFEIAGGERRWSGPTSRGRLVGAIVHYSREGALTSNGREDLDDLSFATRLDAHRDLSERWAADVGWELRQSRTALTVEDAGADALLVAEEAPALARGAAVATSASRLHGGLYGTLAGQYGPLTLLPGLRLSADTLPAARAWPEPRASALVRPTESTLLKIVGGRYVQRPTTEDLLPDTGDPLLPTTDSWQVAGGVEQRVAGRLELGLDSYHKWLWNPLARPIDGPPEALPTGRAWGVEALARYRLRDVFFLWGWVGIGRSLLFDADGRARPGQADQPVSAGVVASWDVGHWTLGARWRTASGLPFTPIDGSLYDAGRDQWTPIPGEDNADRFPTYTKVDARVAHTWTFRSWRLVGSAELWFVPPAATPLYPAWNFDNSEREWVRGPVLLPLGGLRAEF